MPLDEAGATMLAAPAPRHRIPADCNSSPSAVARIAGDYLAAIAEQQGFGAVYRRRLLEAEQMLRATEGKPNARCLVVNSYAVNAARERSLGERSPGDPRGPLDLGQCARPKEHAMQHQPADPSRSATLQALLTYKAAAELLGVSSATIYNLVRRGDLRAVKLGASPNSAVRIDPADLAAYLRRSKTGAPPQEGPR